MVDIANYRFTDVGSRMDRAYDRVGVMRQDSARATAGNALRGGDPATAAGALYGAGMLAEGAVVENRDAAQRAAAATARKDQHGELLKFTTEAAGRLAEVHRQSKDVNKTLEAYDRLSPTFRDYGETDAEIAEVRDAIAKDPENTLLALGAGAAKEAGYELRTSGDEVLVFQAGKLINRFRGSKTEKMGEGDSLYEVPGTGGMGEAPAADRPMSEVSTAPGHPSQAPVANVNDMKAALGRVLGRGAQFTSGYRTPEHNAEVGGVPNSYHTRGAGQALDIVPPPGLTTKEAADRIRASGKYAEVIDEGDHVHVAWDVGGGGASDGSTVIAQQGGGNGAPRLLVQRPKAEKPMSRPATAAEKAAFGIPEHMPAQIKPDGSIDVVGGVGAANNNPRKAAADLRKEFNQRPEVKEYRDVATSYRQIQQLASNKPTAAGDLSLIFSYMKMLDPGSVVREGEFATAQNAAGIPEQVKNLYNRALNGQRLNPKQRADFANQARSIHDTRLKRYADIVGEYRGYAADYDIDPDQVSTVPAAPQNPAAATAPKVGEVRKGYRYKGGDPSKPASWEKV